MKNMKSTPPQTFVSITGKRAIGFEKPLIFISSTFVRTRYSEWDDTAIEHEIIINILKNTKFPSHKACSSHPFCVGIVVIPVESAGIMR